jgi:hypothetical protein
MRFTGRMLPPRAPAASAMQSITSLIGNSCRRTVATRAARLRLLGCAGSQEDDRWAVEVGHLCATNRS